jgi:hypothetical protein
LATIVQRPIKAIVQGDGDVVLGEFTDQDGISLDSLILTSINPQTIQNLRDQLKAANFEKYDNIGAFPIQPQNGLLAQDQNTGKLYISNNLEWNEVGGVTKVSGADPNTGVQLNQQNTNRFSFEGDLKVEYNSALLESTVTVDTSSLTSRLDILEADGTAGNSVRFLIDQAVDGILGGASTQGNTLKKLEDSIDAIETNIGNQNLNAIESEVDAIQAQISDFTYAGNNSTLMNNPDINNLGIIYNRTSQKFEPSQLALGIPNFFKFTKQNGSRDDIPLTTTFFGNTIIEGAVKFFKTDGTRDDVNIIAT